MLALTTTTHPSNVSLASSRQGITVRKVSDAEENRAQDPLVRDTATFLCSETCKRRSQCSYVYMKREQSSTIIAGRTEIAEFSNIGELLVKVRR